MAKVIAVVGSKGGTGKSSLAHMLGHGAGSLPRMVPAVVLTTDPDEALREDRRRYAVADARTPAKLLAELERLLRVDRLLVILDGAAARADLDRVVSEVADLAVLPFTPSRQDAERAAADLDRLPGAIALPNRWPIRRDMRAKVRRYLDLVPEARRLAPFVALPRIADLFDPEGYAAATYDLASPARGLLLEVLAAGRIDPDDLAAEAPAVAPVAPVVAPVALSRTRKGMTAANR